MKTSRLPLAFLLSALALAPLLGGRLALGEDALSLEEWWHEAFISRFFASPGHALLGVLIALSLLTSLRQNVLPMPSPQGFAFLILFYILISLSAVLSHHPQEAWAEWARWSLYLSTLFSAIYTLGREHYVRYAGGAILLGASLVSAQGIAEHWANRATNPGWRIMDGWQNPNALAGYLALVLPFALALALSSWKEPRKETSSPTWKSTFPFALILVGLGVCMSALWLTGSKGGLLSALVGMVGFCLTIALKRPRALGRAAFILGIALILTGIFVHAGTLTPSPAPSRVLAPTAEAEQSVQFRIQLWKDTWELVKKSGYMGVGLGAFGANFPKVSKTEGSLQAHNAYLQWCAETGLIGLLALTGLALFGFFHLLTPHPAAPWEVHVMKAGIIASFLSAGANGFVESHFSFFGFSLTLFALLGMGLLMSPDGVRTERIPLPLRVFPWTTVAVFSALVLISRAGSDVYLASARRAYSQGDYALALAHSEKARFFPITSSRLFSVYARALLGMGRQGEALSAFQNATQQYPSAFTFADLGQAYALLGHDALAEESFKKAIEWSPHHPRWRKILFEFYKERHRIQEAEKTAQELVAMENSLFYQLRALPQFINTDTVDAHLFLADLAHNRADREKEIQHREKAFTILKEYAEKTYQELLRLTGGREELREFPLAGETIAKGEELIRKGISVGKQLVKIYKEKGLDAPARNTEQVIDTLEKMISASHSPES